MVDTLKLQKALLEAPDDAVVTAKDIASAYAGIIKPQTLRFWASEKEQDKLLPFKKIGGKNIYKAGDVRRWLGLDRCNVAA